MLEVLELMGNRCNRRGAEELNEVEVGGEAGGQAGRQAGGEAKQSVKRMAHRSESISLE